MLPPLSLYIHFPWCVQKCPYCDFNSHAIKAGMPELAYVDAVLADLDADIGRFAIDRPVESIFIGGGTPSLMSPDALARLLAGVSRRLRLRDDCEITLEANPATVEAAKFKAFRQLGVNRLSMGVQSFNARHLHALGRIHSSDEAIAAVAMARESGFDNINLDLMFGLPGQRIDDALADVETALSLSPGHVSFYQLTLEPNTWFYRFPPKLPTDDTIFATQKACQQRWAAAGFQQYEVSAYARSGLRCRHNLNYWQFGDYLGIGAGAHGKITLSLPAGIVRTAKARHPEAYLRGESVAKYDAIDVAQLPLEFVMNHLRLREGFAVGAFERLTGLDANHLQPALADCLSQGLLLMDDGVVRCSERGWDFLDAILEKFVP
ncbi:MAG: YggW family oxidoreductase [Methylomonas sp.]|nr:MAG: YggW family oxidoreductase [Methylomonas sp.]PPD27673.1 MAG: YggW family oxidoreductase [Methylomonas sp.]PPD37888.1 MAG: YggW family oxidoreductase [Methylomonas sp.]PPD39684.1 MAG: YggW family oxidoreductase [Methylomonas sp.]PPD51691.1 MAG: YggW family oxidoreductase [Methylomonas sp.]